MTIEEGIYMAEYTITMTWDSEEAV